MRTITHRLKANGLTHLVRDSGDESAPVAVLLHGFPDSSRLWDRVTPSLVNAGYRIIAPDLRGFGDTDLAGHKANYDINVGSIPDVLALLDTLGIEQAHIVGHDFGAPVAWGLAAQNRDRFISLTALSVGHARAYLSAGVRQKLLSWYILFHQFRGICERSYRLRDWALFRRHWSRHNDIEMVISNISRPGRLTAGLDWYRANISISRMVHPLPFGAFGEEIVRIPTLGVWSTGEKYLTEEQMISSERFVKAPWTYERIEGASHWIPLDAPGRLTDLLIHHWRSALPTPPKSP